MYVCSDQRLVLSAKTRSFGISAFLAWFVGWHTNSRGYNISDVADAKDVQKVRLPLSKCQTHITVHSANQIRLASKIKPFRIAIKDNCPFLNICHTLMQTYICAIVRRTAHIFTEIRWLRNSHHASASFIWCRSACEMGEIYCIGFVSSART